jgi:hypothetical protein
MKWILGVSSLIFAAFGVHSTQEFLSRYARVEFYEIRPGVLAMPQYAADGEVCQLALEKRRIRSDGIDLGTSTMPRELVLEMIDELAPRSERGKAVIQLAGRDYMDVISGSTVTAVADYENVSVQIFRTTSANGDIAVLLNWKRDACASPKISKPAKR